MKSYKVHGNIVLYLLIDPVLMPGSRASCTQCELCVILCYCWAWLSWVEENVNSVWFDCAYSCAHHNCVTNITCACLCCTCIFKCKTYCVFSFCCLICCKLSEPSGKDSFWMWVTPQYLLQSQLMALKHVIRCNATPIVNNVYSHMQELQICSSVLRSQPVFNLLLETLKCGWNLDLLDIPVAWMFGLQRTSIHCSSLTKHSNIL